MGCAIACVAARCGVSYQRALKLFSVEKHAWTRGYYCSEIVAALSAAGCDYRYEKFKAKRHASAILRAGTIVFIERGESYPSGHFLIRGREGWMNPWANFPNIGKVVSRFQKDLPGKIEYLVYEFNS